MTASAYLSKSATHKGREDGKDKHVTRRSSMVKIISIVVIKLNNLYCCDQTKYYSQ